MAGESDDQVDAAELLRRAVAEFDARVRRIGAGQWDAATINTGWSVRDLVNHLVYEDLWAPPLFAGSTIAEVGDRYEGDVLGADPVQSWATASGQTLAAVGEDGALARIVHLSFGDVPAAEYAMQLFADHLVHAWDLARAIGADERLDAELVRACATWFADREEGYRGAGAIAARPAVPEGADDQTILLAMFGRSA